MSSTPGRPDLPSDSASPRPDKSALEYGKTAPAAAPDPALAPTIDGVSTPKGWSAEDAAAAELALLAVPGSIPGPLQTWERYQVIRPLGQGGMGTVFLARDRKLGRSVALKFLRLATPESADRMLQEARSQARLTHSGICKVFEVGEFQGQPYIAMEYIQGKPLHLALRGLTLEQKVLLAHQVALAVHAAHSQGILHRDLKPANIMVCDVESELSSGEVLRVRPVLMDFGLARDSLGPQRLTQTGMIMGTPHYMAPEQARGDSRNLDRRADVYSLGAILYELLTGRPPFDVNNEVDLILAVLHQDPQPPRELVPSVPIDLEVIALKCLRKEPEQRYASALALAEDLQRYLRSEPIMARPASTLYRLRRLAVRHRSLLAVGLVIGTALAALLGVTLHSRAREHQVAERAKVQRQHAGELGEKITHMNLFLRVAYSLPVHDLGQERELVRKPLRVLEEQLPQLDPDLYATQQSAVGQGYLVLREYDLAIVHLQLALQHGDTAAGTHLALGQALGGLYEQKADVLRDELPREQATPRIAELATTYLVRARQELQLGENADNTDPLYVQALLLFYLGEAQYDQALVMAQKAHQAAPWLIEPLDLETKIISQQYTDRLIAGDFKALKDEAAVRKALAQAIIVARSYPEFYHTFAKFSRITLARLTWQAPDVKDYEAFYADVINAAKAAVTLMPESPEGYDQLASDYALWALILANAHKDPQPTVEEGLKVADHAVNLKPERARPYGYRSLLYLALSTHQRFLGEESIPSGKSAVQDARRSVELDPQSFQGANRLAIALGALAESKRLQGVEADHDYLEMIDAEKRCFDLRPDKLDTIELLAYTYINHANRLVEEGRDASTYTALAEKLIAMMQNKHPSFEIATLRIKLDQVNVLALRQENQDVVGKAQELVAASRQVRRKQPHTIEALLLEAQSYLALGEALLARGAAPLAAFQEALAEVATMDRQVLGAGKAVELQGRIRLQQALATEQAKQSPEPILRLVIREVTQAMERKADAPSELLALRAKTLRLLVKWQKSKGQSSAALTTIEQGLRTCAEAQHRGFSGVFELQIEEGALLALKAQLLPAGEVRQQTAGQAATALTQALAKQPPQSREFRPYLQAAEQLAAPPQ